MLVTLTSPLEAIVNGMAGNDHAASQGSATQDARSMPERRLAERKSVLRKDLLAARARLSVSDRRAAGQVLRDTVLGLPETQMAGTIAAYLSVGTGPERGRGQQRRPDHRSRAGGGPAGLPARPGRRLL